MYTTEGGTLIGEDGLVVSGMSGMLLKYIHSLCSSHHCEPSSRQQPPLMHTGTPTPFSHLKDGDPGVADVIKVDGSFEGVDVSRRAVTVVLVPVDTGGVVCAVVGLHVHLTLETSLLIQGGHRGTQTHAVLPGHGADEGVLVIVLRVVIVAELDGQRTGERGERVLQLGF